MPATCAAPVPPMVVSKPTSPSLVGVCIFAALLPLVEPARFTVLPAWFAGVSPLVVAVELCPRCGVGHLETIWRANRPSGHQLENVAILDTS
jgi:hypothetical protein